MAQQYVSFDVSVHVEKRDTCWAATTSPFAITVYSDDRHKAEERALKAVGLLLDSQSGAIAEFLAKLRVKHLISVSEEPDQENCSDFRQEISVPIYA